LLGGRDKQLQAAERAGRLRLAWRPRRLRAAAVTVYASTYGTLRWS
jgi:hypothetical protein